MEKVNIDIRENISIINCLKIMSGIKKEIDSMTVNYQHNIDEDDPNSMYFKEVVDKVRALELLYRKIFRITFGYMREIELSNELTLEEYYWFYVEKKNTHLLNDIMGIYQVLQFKYNMSLGYYGKMKGQSELKSEGFLKAEKENSLLIKEMESFADSLRKESKQFETEYSRLIEQKIDIWSEISENERKLLLSLSR